MNTRFPANHKKTAGPQHFRQKQARALSTSKQPFASYLDVKPATEANAEPRQHPRIEPQPTPASKALLLGSCCSAGAAKQVVQLKRCKHCICKPQKQSQLAAAFWAQLSWLGPTSPRFAQGSVMYLVVPSDTNLSSINISDSN